MELDMDDAVHFHTGASGSAQEAGDGVQNTLVADGLNTSVAAAIGGLLRAVGTNAPEGKIVHAAAFGDYSPTEGLRGCNIQVHFADAAEEPVVIDGLTVENPSDEQKALFAAAKEAGQPAVTTQAE